MKSLAFGASLLLMAGPAPSMAEDIIIGLITKTDTNPFFVKMKEGASAKAAELGVDFKAYAGKVTALVGDNGAGKSSLIKCFSGAHIPDLGDMFINGEKVEFKMRVPITFNAA